MLVLPLLFFGILIWYMIICYKWKRDIFNVVEKIPGMRWYPIFGNTYIYLPTTRENVLDRFFALLNEYKPFFKTWNGNYPEVHIMKPEHLQIVLKSSTHTPKGPFYQHFLPWLREGLFTAEGAKWFLQRRLLTPTFHFKILDGFLETFAENSKLLLEKFESKADGDYFNIVPELAHCALRIICETSMGVPVEVVVDKPYDLMRNIHDITEIIMWRYWRPYIIDPIFYLLPKGRQFKRLVKTLDEFTDRVVTYRKQNYDSNLNQDAIGRKRMSFMDMLLDANDKQNIMDDADLKALVSTFLLAATETTSNTISWTLFSLGNNPVLQEKAYEEVRRVLKDKPAPTTMEELNDLKYIECVVKETMRLYPILPFITRKLSEDVVIDGYKVPKDTQVLAHILMNHLDPENYPDPMKFDPDRFLPENTKQRHPFAYIPFSAGPRNCLGTRFALLEMKVALAAIIKKFKVTSLETSEEVKVFVHVLLRPRNGLKLKVELRSEQVE